MIELEPAERHDELAALIADHLKQGGETLEAARWSARAAHWAGHSRPRDAMRLWHETMELAGELEENEETDALGIASRLPSSSSPGASAWTWRSRRSCWTKPR